MRSCPHCHASGISRRRLFAQALNVPGIIVSCSACGAIVLLKEREGLLFGLFLELVFAVTLLVSILHFLNPWVGFAAFVAWRLIRLAVKTNGTLECIQG